MPDLELLLTLQERDLALDRLRHQKANLPERERLEASTARLGTLDASRAERQAQRDEHARTEQRFADEAQQLTEQIAATETRLYSGEVASPRDLQSLQADVEQLRRRQGTVEDRQLAAMEQREPLDTELDQLTSERDTLAAEVEAVRAELGAHEDELDQALGAEQAARDAIAADIAPRLVADYERRRARARGVGAARVVGMTCQGCHLSIPATEVDRMRRQDGAVAYCDNCGCILVP